MSAVLAFPLSPFAPAVAAVGPYATPSAAGDTPLSRAVDEAASCRDLAERSYSLGLTGLGDYWLGQARAALEALA